MQPVEVPDYSGLFAAVSIVLAVATVICALTSTKADNKILNFLKSVSFFFLQKNNVTSGNKMYVAMCGFKVLGKGGVPTWECNCGNLNCEDFEKLAKAVGGTDATPPVHPVPDRRAAVAHTKAKS